MPSVAKPLTKLQQQLFDLLKQNVPGEEEELAENIRELNAIELRQNIEAFTFNLKVERNANRR